MKVCGDCGEVGEVSESAEIGGGGGLFSVGFCVGGDGEVDGLFELEVPGLSLYLLF